MLLVESFATYCQTLEWQQHSLYQNSCGRLVGREGCLLHRNDHSHEEPKKMRQFSDFKFLILNTKGRNSLRPP